MNPLFDLSTKNLAGKSILEIGSGRGETTRKLASLLGANPGARLIATDVSAAFFPVLEKEFSGSGIRFMRTDARSLAGIEDGSVDHIVCNYTLCAVERQAGSARHALERFWQVMVAGGGLYIEEEFPIEMSVTPAQDIWAEKWRILKAALLAAGQMPYQEFTPENLARLVTAAGFSDLAWEADVTILAGDGVLDFFHARLKRLMTSIHDASLKTGFLDRANALDRKLEIVGRMEIPFYRLYAGKK